MGGGGGGANEETVSVNFDHKVNFCSIFSLHINDLSAEIATCFVLYVTQFSCLRVEVNISLQVAHAVTNPMIFSPSFNSVRLERKPIRQDYLCKKQLIFGPLNLWFYIFLDTVPPGKLIPHKICLIPKTAESLKYVIKDKFRK